jgi:hypothetical protein
MITGNHWHLICAFLLSALAHAQDAKPSAAPLSVRAFLHDPSRGVAELYVKDVIVNISTHSARFSLSISDPAARLRCSQHSSIRCRNHHLQNKPKCGNGTG